MFPNTKKERGWFGKIPTLSKIQPFLLVQISEELSWVFPIQNLGGNLSFMLHHDPMQIPKSEVVWLESIEYRCHVSTVSIYGYRV